MPISVSAVIVIGCTSLATLAVAGVIAGFVGFFGIGGVGLLLAASGIAAAHLWG